LIKAIVLRFCEIQMKGYKYVFICYIILRWWKWILCMIYHICLYMIIWTKC